MYSFKDFDIKQQKTILKNGMPLVLFYKKGMPIHIETRFASGSRFDPLGKEGLAHFVEHMISAGTEKFPSKDKMAVFIEQLGGVFSASTSADSLSVVVEIAGKEDLDNAVELFNEMLVHPLMNEKTIEMERNAILKEVGEKNSTPSKYIRDLSSELFYQKTEVGKSNLGTKESLSNITKKDLEEFRSKMLASGRGVVVVCGDTEIDALAQKLNDNLQLKKTERPAFGDDLPINRDKNIMTKKYEKQEQVWIAFGFRTVSIKNNDHIALSLLANIVGGGRASLLQRKLRYEKGLVYSVSALAPVLVDRGMWAVFTSTSKEKLQEVVNLIAETFNDIYNGKIDEKELEFAKDKIIKSSRRNMQTSSSWVSAHSYYEMIGDSQTLPDYLNLVDRVTVDDLKQVGKKYFQKDSWFLAMCGDVDEGSVVVNY